MTRTLFDNIQITVQIGFDTTSGANKVPLGGNLSDIIWYGVDEYTRSVNITRGRSSELDEFTTGTAQIVLSNKNRFFDPEYNFGPFYGKITPGRPIRVMANDDIREYPIFFGFIDEWDQDYDYTFDATVSITASDAFKVLNSIELDSFWDYTIKQDNPIFWLKLSEATGSTVALDSEGKVSGFTWVDLDGDPSEARGTSGLITDSDEGAAQFTGTNGIVLPFPGPTVFKGSPNDIDVTLEFLFTTDLEANDDYGMVRIGAYEVVIGAGLDVTDGVGTIKVWQGSVSGINSVYVWTSTVKVNDGLPHHVIIPLWGSSYSPARKPRVDGVEMTLQPSFSFWTVFDPVPTLEIGLPMTQLTANNFPEPFTGTIGQVVLHPRTFTDSEMIEHYQIATDRYLAGQLSSNRITTLLDMASWMFDARDIGLGDASVQAIRTGGKTLLQALKEVEAAEQGRLFIDPAGKVKFIPRLAISTTAIYNTSQVTYGDGPGEKPYSDIQYSYNDRLIYNRVTISKREGGNYTANDTFSQGEYFIRVKTSDDLIVESETILQDLAFAQLLAYKEPKLRVQSLTLNPRKGGVDLYTGILKNDLGTRMTVIRRPQGVGNPINQVVLLEGVSHQISSDTWTTNYSLAPSAVDYFVLSSASLGIMDVNVLGFEER
jgi:hypothetical protein